MAVLLIGLFVHLSTPSTLPAQELTFSGAIGTKEAMEKIVRMAVAGN